LLQLYQMSHTTTFTPLYSSTYIGSSSITPSPSSSSTGTQTASVSLASSSILTLSPSPSVSYLSPSSSLGPSLVISPSPTSTKLCKLTSTTNTTVLGSISDNTFYSVTIALVFIFIVNAAFSLHYYNAYTNEKIRRRIINNQVQYNPYHTGVRDTFIRV
jgi:hypothetical protein